MTAVEAAARLAPRFAARAAAHDETGEFPTDDFADLRDAGLFGLMAACALTALVLLAPLEPGQRFGRNARRIRVSPPTAVAIGSVVGALAFQMRLPARAESCTAARSSRREASNSLRRARMSPSVLCTRMRVREGCRGSKASARRQHSTASSSRTSRWHGQRRQSARPGPGR